jgi:bacterioferritin-associated ferredoxin
MIEKGGVMYIYEMKKLKEMLGLGLTAKDTEIVEAVQSMCASMQEIRNILGLPPHADCQEIVAALRARERGTAPAKAEEKGGWFKSLFKI